MAPGPSVRVSPATFELGVQRPGTGHVFRPRETSGSGRQVGVCVREDIGGARARARSGVRTAARTGRRMARVAVGSGVRVLDPVGRPVVTAVQRLRGGLDPDAMLAAYREGRFAMAGTWGRISWQRPGSRAVLPLDERRRVRRSLARVVRNGPFTHTFDAAFDEVLHHCATAGSRQSVAHQWLSADVAAAFRTLHRRGYAHSTEVWRDGRLVGGEFGVALGGFYAGESMFHLEPNAGKVALAHLVEHLHQRGFELFDTQVLSPVAEQFGGYEIGRDEYERRLRAALAKDVSFSAAATPVVPVQRSGS